MVNVYSGNIFFFFVFLKRFILGKKVAKGEKYSLAGARLSGNRLPGKIYRELSISIGAER